MKKWLLGFTVLCSVQFAAAQNKNFDLYVVAEGNFGTPNGDVFKVSRTNSVTLTTSGALYQTANSTTGIDVLQDFGVFGNKAVLCGKGGSPVKLAITNYPSFDTVKTFTTIGGIQCLGKASNTKGYVSMAGGGNLQLLDLTNNTLTPVTDPTSMLSSYASYMAQANGAMYVAIGSKIVKVDTVTNTATATLLPNIGSIAGMEYDATNNCIWLLGKVSGTSVLVKLEPANSDLLNTPITLTGVTNAAQLRLALNKLYFLSGKNVHAYNIASPNIPTTALYTSNLSGNSFSFAYGKSFAVDPATGDFALASATNFASPSIYEVVDGTTFQVIDTGSVTGRIANELTLHTYLMPVPDSLSLPDIVAECSATLTAPTATAGSVTITGTTSDPLSYDQQGNHTVTWLYINGYDTATQTQQVIIDDTTAPVPDVAALPALQGDCPYTLTPAVATDNCIGAVTGTTGQLTFTTGGNFTITWTYNDGHGNSATQTQQLTVNCTTGIEETGEPLAFSLFPNPANNEVTLRTGSGTSQRYDIGIYTVVGQKITELTTTATDTKISLRGYVPGLYYVKITRNGAVAGKTQALIVQ